GQAIFEGMKAFRNAEGDILLFRPLENLARLNRSAERMCMPEVPEELFMESLKELLRLDADWIPTGEGQSLYVRPFMIATEEFLGVKPSSSYKFMIICSPVGNYYSQPVKVKIESEYSRATEGGVGYAKTAGNYGSSLYPARLAQATGYDQLIWTDSHRHEFIEEAGTMNVAFVIDNTLITPTVSSTILAGITRDSALQLARHWDIPVEERRISVHEVIAALENGTMQEAFGVGTAATIAPLSLIGWNGQDYHLPPAETFTVANRLKNALEGMKRGTTEDPFGWVTRL
ncbi:MAG: branched-chain amino acid aminotransferase, partial [Bacteroidota bacterium]